VFKELHELLLDPVANPLIWMPRKSALLPWSGVGVDVEPYVPANMSLEGRVGGMPRLRLGPCNLVLPLPTAGAAKAPKEWLRPAGSDKRAGGMSGVLVPRRRCGACLSWALNSRLPLPQHEPLSAPSTVAQNACLSWALNSRLPLPQHEPLSAPSTCAPSAPAVSQEAGGEPAGSGSAVPQDGEESMGGGGGKELRKPAAWRSSAVRISTSRPIAAGLLRIAFATAAFIIATTTSLLQSADNAPPPAMASSCGAAPAKRSATEPGKPSAATSGHGMVTVDDPASSAGSASNSSSARSAASSTRSTQRA